MAGVGVGVVGVMVVVVVPQVCLEPWVAVLGHCVEWRVRGRGGVCFCFGAAVFVTIRDRDRVGVDGECRDCWADGAYGTDGTCWAGRGDWEWWWWWIAAY